MAWYTGAIAAAQGALIAVLDAELIKNSHWTIFDAVAGVNAKVYRCLDPDDGTEFYWYVDDNVSTDYAQTKLYETWDAVGHTGTGGGSFSSFRHKLGAYNISLDDTQLIYIDTSGVQGNGCFVGRVQVVDPTAPQVIAIMGHTAATNTGLPLTAVDVASVIKYLMRGTLGLLAENFGWVGFSSLTATNGPDTRYSLDVNGKAWFNRGWIHAHYRLIGFIEGVIPLGTTTTYGHGDIISIGGEDWMVIRGEGGPAASQYALIKK